LTLAKYLVEMHGGTIEAKSEGRDKGSEFIVRLPVAQGDSGSKARSSARPEESANQASRRVLVVDDRRVQAESLGMLLEAVGHEVRIALDGPGALEISAEFNPEVALVDIGLPGMSGYELARRLRAHPRHKNMLLIAQTGWGREEDRQRSRDAGFDHHLAKPIDHETLFRLLVKQRATD
jgi:CheY-like chemotaxis protein